MYLTAEGNWVLEWWDDPQWWVHAWTVLSSVGYALGMLLALL